VKSLLIVLVDIMLTAFHLVLTNNTNEAVRSYIGQSEFDQQLIEQFVIKTASCLYNSNAGDKVV